MTLISFLLQRFHPAPNHSALPGVVALLNPNCPPLNGRNLFDTSSVTISVSGARPQNSFNMKTMHFINKLNLAMFLVPGGDAVPLRAVGNLGMNIEDFRDYYSSNPA
jgi:hypothetical protein